ncbi:branched-chain amino acid ABC transporter permease [Dactylosporangium sp. CS-033363]|uniref:branched-chain amino acid ABC transporter permease n=1 Tax=Dactylosporangium sp. CS-033363 TaxID=3239935 RepID=UPI003D8EA723
MGTFVSVFVSGVALGSISALVALGFLVTYKATSIVNFAQGGMVTLGGYLGYLAVVQIGMPWWIGYPLAIAAMFAVGVLVERIVHAPLRHRPELVVVIATLGVGLVISAILLELYGTETRNLPALLAGRVVHVAGANIAAYDLIVIGVTVVAVAALTLLFNRTQLGRQFRAASADPEVAQLQGIPVKAFGMFAFGLGGLLAGVAGIMLAPRASLDTGFGFTAMITAFAAAVIGGFGRFSGVIVGALVLGLVQQLGTQYIAYQYAAVYPFALMILIVAIAPRGVLGSTSRVRV